MNREINGHSNLGKKKNIKLLVIEHSCLKVIKVSYMIKNCK